MCSFSEGIDRKWKIYPSHKEFTVGFRPRVVLLLEESVALALVVEIW